MLLLSPANLDYRNAAKWLIWVAKEGPCYWHCIKDTLAVKPRSNLPLLERFGFINSVITGIIMGVSVAPP